MRKVAIGVLVVLAVTSLPLWPILVLLALAMLAVLLVLFAIGYYAREVFLGRRKLLGGKVEEIRK